MKIIRAEDGSPMEAKLNSVCGVVRRGVRFQPGVSFRLNLSPALTDGGNNPVWEAWRVEIVVEGDGPDKRVEMDDCLDIGELPKFAVANNLLTSYGLSSAVSHEATRWARLTVESEGTEVDFSLDIGKYRSDKAVDRADVYPMVQVKDLQPPLR